MKKIVCIVLAMILSIGIIGTCLASDVDVSSMSLEELISLRGKITEEIYSRFGSGDAIYAGDYKGGVDIKSGTYVLTCTKETPSASDDLVLGIYNDDDKYLEFKDSGAYREFRDNAILFMGVQKDGSATFTIEDGQHLIIKWGDAVLMPYAPSWAP